mgnify:CR=1 FL=1|tara:strand:- start:44 stop:283 length:240 start_codon:yes stop_codon:yes gene_type:complete
MYNIKLEEGGFIVYNDDKRMNKQPFTSQSKARNYIKDLEAGSADESKYHATKGIKGRSKWKEILKPNFKKAWQVYLTKA